MSGPPLPSVRGSLRWREALGALLLAVFLTALVDSFTGLMPPKWDPVSYTDMAVNGVIGNPRLIAPYAYRPAMPLLAGVLSRAFEVPVGIGFLWIARGAVVCLLFCTFLLARRFAGGGLRATIPVFFAAASIMPVKFALFVPASVDVAAYPIMVLAVWAYLSGRLAASLWISAAGLFFKEFLAIPLLLAVAEYARLWRVDRSRRAGWILAGALALALSVILIPRLGLSVVDTRQEIDPLHNIHSLSRLVMNPLNPARDLNIVLSLLAFWLPVLLLLTRARLRAVLADCAPWRRYLAWFLGLNLLLVMYGGTNLLTFISYALPVQILVLALLAARGAKNDAESDTEGGGVRPVEWLLALAFTVAYNRVFGTIPFPDDGFEAYIDYYSGWSSRVSLSTLLRFLEIGLYAGVFWALRRFVLFRPPAR